MKDISTTTKPARGEVVDIDAAAAILGVTPRWIRRAVHENELPYFKLRRLVRFHIADLDDYLRSQRVPARRR